MSGDGEGAQAAPGTPRWVKVFGIVTLVVLIALGVMLATGGTEGHGPGRHRPPIGGH